MFLLRNYVIVGVFNAAPDLWVPELKSALQFLWFTDY